jgi:hypothetical protein
VRSRTGPGFLRFGLLVLLLGVLGLKCFYTKTSVQDADLWLHLKVGDWIVHHHAVPFTDAFSWTAAGRPWLAYSWLPEVLLYLAYRGFGIVGIGVYGTCLTLLTASAVMLMAWRLSGRFWLSCLLAAAACDAFLFNSLPRPLFFSMISLCVMLALLLLAHRTENVRLLYWLPLLFWIWSNSHVQFIYGIAVLGLFVATILVQRMAAHFGMPSWWMPSTLPPWTLLAIFVACLLATLLGPYSFHLYARAYAYSQAKAIYALVLELQPLSFRSPHHYVQLLLTAAAFFAVGWNKKIDVFKLVLLVMCTVVAYRALRESWFICIASVACIADSAVNQPDTESRQVFPTITFAFVAAWCCLLPFAHLMDFDTHGLAETISDSFPVRAADAIRGKKLPGSTTASIGAHS